MPIDDPLDQNLEWLKEEARGYISEDAANFALEVAAHVLFIKPVLDALKDSVRRRFTERLVGVLIDMKDQLNKIDRQKINREYFQSDEFLTILYLVAEQLSTTHDKSKLRMLASALANSAVSDFAAETRKELFVRILRDLTPEHVSTLRDLTEYVITNPMSAQLSIIQGLVAHGLVNESYNTSASLPQPRFGLEWTVTDAERAINDYIRDVLSRHYIVSDLGHDFICFLSEYRDEPTDTNS